MVKKIIEEVLAELGWSDGFRMPVANEENKALELEVERKLKEKVKISNELEEITDRINALNKHKQNINNEHHQNQIFITAHQEQLSTEDHIYRMCKAEEQKLKQDIRKFGKELESIGARKIILQNDFMKHHQKLDQLKSAVKWDKETLLAWEEDTIREDEDTQMIERFTTEDESKFNALELQRQQLRKQVDILKNQLDNMVLEVITEECALEKTAHMYRKIHNERQDLLQQWEATVKILQQRDTDINKIIQQIAEIKQQARVKLEEVNERRRFAENEKINNNELSKQIDELTRKAAMNREEHKNIVDFVTELTTQLHTTERNVKDMAVKLEKLRGAREQYIENSKSKKNHIDALKTDIANLKVNLKEISNVRKDTESQMKQLEELIKKEEKNHNVLESETERLSVITFSARKNFLKMKQQLELQEIEISAMYTSKLRLASQEKNLEKEMQRQKEIQYNLDFNIQKLESRMEYLMGDHHGESKDSKDSEESFIVELQETFASKSATLQLLNSQVQRIEETIRRLQGVLAKDDTELEKLKYQRQDKWLMLEGGEKMLKQAKHSRYERQVEENILRLRVDHAMKAINKEGGKVFSLEKQKIELEAAMKERQAEIEVHKNLLKVQKQALNEEKCRLSVEIRERETKIAQLQKKFEIALSSLGSSDDGEQMSVAQIKLKNAQEKVMLQEEGDALDAKIRKAEKEILAMENTLKVVNASNDTFKRNLSMVDKNGPEFQELDDLQHQYYSAVDHLRHRKEQLNDLKTDLEVMLSSLEQLQKAEEELKLSWREKDHEAALLDKILHEQQEKLYRADRQLMKLVKEHRGSAHISMKTFDERDMDVRDMAEQNQNALNQLAELVASHVETRPVVIRYLTDRNLVLPDVETELSSRSQKSASGSATSFPRSTGSSTSSGRSAAKTNIVQLDPEKLHDSSSLRICGTVGKLYKDKKAIKKKPRKKE